jgi:hypothetical protein
MLSVTDPHNGWGFLTPQLMLFRLIIAAHLSLVLRLLVTTS